MIKPAVRAVTTMALTAVMLLGIDTTAPFANAADPVAGASSPDRPSSAAPDLISAGSKGFDARSLTSSPQTAANCFKSNGYAFGILDDSDPMLTADYSALVSAGVKTLLYQGFDSSAFSSIAMATSRAKAMVTAAQEVGYPTGSQLFVDIEYNNSGTTEANQIAWVQAWAKQVAGSGYAAGVYIGEPQELQAADFNEISMPDVSVHWQSLSSSSPKPAQGFVAKQSVGSTVCGVSIDADVASTDAYGTGLVGSEGGGTTARTSPGVSGAIASDGSYHVFEIGSDHALYQVAHTAAGWSSRQNLGGTLVGTPAVTYIAASNRYDVFAVGSSGAIYRKSYSAGSWGNWTAVSTPGFVGGLTAAVAADGTYHVFGIGSDHHLYQVAHTASGWAPRQDLGGSLVGTPGVTYQASSGRIDVFAVGTDGRIHQDVHLSAWGGLAPITTTGFVGGVSAVIATDGSYHLFGIRSADRALYQVVHSSAGWSAPQSLGGGLIGSPGATYQTSVNRFTVYAVSEAGSLYQQVHNSTWSGFEQIAPGPFV